MRTSTAPQNSPAAICAEIEISGGHDQFDTHAGDAAASPNRKRAIQQEQPNGLSPASVPCIYTPELPAAKPCAHPTVSSPQATYTPTPETTEAIDQIVTLHRERQANIRAKTKLILQAKALLRSQLCSDADYEDDDTKSESETAYGTKRRKLTKSAVKRVDDAMAAAIADPISEHGVMLAPYLAAIDLFEKRQSVLERAMVKQAKRLPVYDWVKSVKGFGDVSFATIVGEAGDIGTYKSHSAVWKRLGLAVINGKRQGAPGDGATREDWVAHGYSKARRSVSWNARQHVIGGMGKWRPSYGENVHTNPGLTEYQRLYAERARVEAEKLNLPITESATGKESYKMHVSNRAHRYVEKRLIRDLRSAWRQA